MLSTRFSLLALVLVSTSAELTIAQTAPEFPVSVQLQTVDGKNFDSKMFATDKELLIIDFWNRSCAPCVDAFNKFRDNYDTLIKKTQATIIAVAVQKQDEATLKLIDKEKWPFKVYFDTNTELYKALSRWYQPGTVEVAFPAMYIFDKTNKMLTRVVGSKLKVKEGVYPPEQDDHQLRYDEVLEIDMEAYYAIFEAVRKQ